MICHTEGFFARCVVGHIRIQRKQGIAVGGITDAATSAAESAASQLAIHGRINGTEVGIAAGIGFVTGAIGTREIDCFAAGTQVQMVQEDGKIIMKDIEKIKVGDYVLSPKEARKNNQTFKKHTQTNDSKIMIIMHKKGQKATKQRSVKIVKTRKSIQKLGLKVGREFLWKSSLKATPQIMVIDALNAIKKKAKKAIDNKQTLLPSFQKTNNPFPKQLQLTPAQ